MTFEVIPSIDLLGGRVVRLERGDYATPTVFGEDAVAVARDWESQGGVRLHIVDLDGARSGQAGNREVVSTVVEQVGIPVQVAGGIRSIEAAVEWVRAGADRVVLGTRALTDEAFLREAVAELGSRLVVAADAQGGEVRVAGWTEGTGEDVVDAVRRIADIGVERLLVTDISQDGMLTGPNVDLLTEVAEAAGVPVIASGGVSTIEDLRTLSGIDGIEGAVIGRALYVGAFELADAVKAVA